MDRYVIDCDSKILGRLASSVAKLLLNGDSVALVNAERAVISGHIRSMMKGYKRRMELTDKPNPNHSPYISRRPDLMVKRTVRGMLPYKKAKGREAYKRLRVYIGIPEELKKEKLHKIAVKDKKVVFEKTFTVNELLKKLGYKV